MTHVEDALATYRSMVRERHAIWQRRQDGQPGPWTHDPVLKNLKMTNMFRVLDPGSQFVFGLRAENPIDVISRLVFYRITNSPKTWNTLRASLGDYPKAVDFIHQSAIMYHILDAYRKAGNRIFGGAYIIVPEPGTPNDKLGGALRVARFFVQEKARAFLAAETPDDQFQVLLSTPGLGPFLSMQILADWGYLQPEEPDLSFVIAGPGARRGTRLVNPAKFAEVIIADEAIRWADDETVRLGGRPLTPMDVQNSFCEFSKFAREQIKPRKKTPYKPAHPGPQAKPILPVWW